MTKETKHNIGDEVIYWHRDNGILQTVIIQRIVVMDGNKVYYKVKAKRFFARDYDYNIPEGDLFKTKEDALVSSKP